MGLDVLCGHFRDKSDCKQMKNKIICCESVLNFLSAWCSLSKHLVVRKQSMLETKRGSYSKADTHTCIWT